MEPKPSPKTRPYTMVSLLSWYDGRFIPINLRNCSMKGKINMKRMPTSDVRASIRNAKNPVKNPMIKDLNIVLSSKNPSYLFKDSHITIRATAIPKMVDPVILKSMDHNLLPFLKRFGKQKP